MNTTQRINLFTTEIHDLTPKKAHFFSKTEVTTFAYSNDTLLGIHDKVLNRRFVGIKNKEYELSILLKGLINVGSNLPQLEILQVALSKEAENFDPKIRKFANEFNQITFCDLMCETFDMQKHYFHKMERKTVESSLYTFFIYLVFLWFIRHGEFNFVIHELKKDNKYEHYINEIITMRDDGEEFITEMHARDIASTFNIIYYEMVNTRKVLRPSWPNFNDVNNFLLDLRYGKLKKMMEYSQ